MGIFGGNKTVTPPAPPPPLLPPPAAYANTLQSVAPDTALKAQKQSVKNSVSTFGNTIATSPEGDMTKASTGSTTLLGQNTDVFR